MQKGGGTGPMIPWQPTQTRKGANSDPHCGKDKPKSFCSVFLHIPLWIRNVENDNTRRFTK